MTVEEMFNQSLDNIRVDTSNPPQESTTTLPDQLPPNKRDHEVKPNTLRFSSALWFEKMKEQTILLAGIGGIGSYVGFLLSRLNPKSILVYDPDRIEATNMSGQLYREKEIGTHKVLALGTICREFSNYGKIYMHSREFTRNSPPEKIMICGFDKMTARRTFFYNWKQFVISHSEEYRKECLFIDGRLAAESLQILAIKGDDEYAMKKYEEEYLFSDEEADATICSYKQTSHCACIIGGLIVNILTNFIANQCNPLIPRDVPFFTMYKADLMYFNTEE